ncbi:trypsin-like peptidase domain-containing protein [Nostoc sp.]|uniref:trypsin-like peptidase domain-containing protein n=1 Tax=Nostoc sp. TaxID=1180 RepID=UPI002FF4B52D
MSINFNQSILVNKEYWIKQGFPGMHGTSNIGVDEELLKLDAQPESLDKVIAIIQERLHVEQRSLITAVIGEQHFLPLSFFETGVKQSLEVCRIARYFSLEAFKKFIEDIKNEIKKPNITNDFASNFDSIAKIKEIFSFSDRAAESIKGLKDCDSKLSTDENLEISIANLEALKNITPNQLTKINPVPIGSGFLVGVTHLITNQHVIQDAKAARECVAQFNYVDDTQGNTVLSIDYQLAPEILFISERSLDYTLVQLKSGIFTPQAGFNFGLIQLVEDENNICPGLEYISINNGDKKQEINILETKLASEKQSNLSLKPYEFDIKNIQDKLFVFVKNVGECPEIKNQLDSYFSRVSNKKFAWRFNYYSTTCKR